jgi:hypothetical protein
MTYAHQTLSAHTLPRSYPAPHQLIIPDMATPNPKRPYPGLLDHRTPSLALCIQAPAHLNIPRHVALNLAREAQALPR